MKSPLSSPERISLAAGLSLGLTLLAGCQPAPKPNPGSGAQGATNQPPAAAISAVRSTNEPAPNIAKGDPAELLQEQASAALEQGDFPSAVRRFDQLVKLRPEDEEAFFNLAYAQSRARQTNEAIRSYERCLELLPSYAEAHNNLGNLLLAQKRFEEAGLHFRTALTNQPESALTLNNLGKLQAMQSKPHEAIPLFREALRLDPKNWDARYNVAVAYLSLGMLEESRAELRLIVDENPGMVVAKRTLARVEDLRRQRAGVK